MTQRGEVPDDGDIKVLEAGSAIILLPSGATDCAARQSHAPGIFVSHSCRIHQSSRKTRMETTPETIKLGHHSLNASQL